MKCPTCPDAHLVITDRQGVEIDYCPACGGIWLDRGELDKLLDHATYVAAPTASEPTPTPRSRSHPDYRAAIATMLENFTPQTADRAPASSTANVTRAAARSRR
jgi:Zn-finger nucleic acid-binding protein